MASEYTFVFPLEHGLHARPASILQEMANGYPATIRLTNNRNGREANAKSVLSLVAADVHLGDPCTLTVEGDGESATLGAMKTFLTDVFPDCDEPLPEVETAPEGAAFIPRPIRNANVPLMSGIPVSPGLAEAPGFVLGHALPAGFPEDTDDPEEEIALVRAAVATAGADMEDQLEASTNATEAAIIKAHLAIVRDPEFLETVERIIRGGNASAGRAISEARQHYAAMLQAAESAYLRERAVDVRDVAAQLLLRLYPDAEAPAVASLSAPAIVLAEDVTPSEFLALDKSLCQGMVLSQGSATSHTAILARAFGVPCVVGVNDADRALEAAGEIMLDARRGLVFPNPSEPVRRYYTLERTSQESRAAQLSAYVTAPGQTADGRRFQVAANIGTAEEVDAAIANGAEGVGLFRTEMLFMDREAPPDEEEQYRAYSHVAAACGEHGVIIRTLDIGGDKPVPYLEFPPEPNPFLGDRAVRFYPRFNDLVKTQLRAILRAATAGKAKIMVPMISCVEEMRTAKAMVAEARAELEAEGTAFGEVQVGMMVEVPSAALLIDQLSAEADFFSIGTNDLAQYTMAADRGNPRVAALASPFHPAFLRLLKKIVDDAHAAGRWVGLCGEMGGSEKFAPLLVGLGLDEISLAGPNVPAMKAAISKLPSDGCRALVESAAAQPTAADAEALVAGYSPAGKEAGILDPMLMNLHSGARSREEAVKELVDRLYLAGRCTSADAVEEAIWNREDVYSTGIGFGFAIPHCKSKDVTTNSVGLLRLDEPMPWATPDSDPVRLVVMLAIRDADQGDEHLRLFARLARKIMHEEFRERLLEEQDVNTLLEFIGENLEA